MSTLRRQVKNVALNYTDAQVKVREATRFIGLMGKILRNGIFPP
jgi:hypothetical protein